MIVRTPQASQVLLIRPGATDFDDQGRIKGTLDMPMSERGRQHFKPLKVRQFKKFESLNIF